MSETYRLVYSGEVLQGQHPAVVKKRLAAVLKLSDERMDVLFSGKSVVVKKQADAQMASRYQGAFEKAGARLRVLPAEDADTPAPPQSSAPVAADSEQSDPEASPTPATRMSVMPAGEDLVRSDERPPTPAPDLPDVDHLSLAELGARLGKPGKAEFIVAEVEFDFDLAEVGAIIGAVDQNLPEQPLPDADFDLAEPGAQLSQAQSKPPPSPPDTSHITFDPGESDETT